MRLFPIFLAAVFAGSFFSNLREQATHLRTGVSHHANSAHTVAKEKLSHTYAGLKTMYENIKEKILSKLKRRDDVKKVDDDDKKNDDDRFDVNSSTLNEFLRKFKEELSMHQKLEASRHEGCNHEHAPGEECHEAQAPEEVPEESESTNEKAVL